jgi:hypothetical protein
MVDIPGLAYWRAQREQGMVGDRPAWELEELRAMMQLVGGQEARPTDVSGQSRVGRTEEEAALPELPHEEASKLFHPWRSRNTVPDFKNERELDVWVNRLGEGFVSTYDDAQAAIINRYLRNLPADKDAFKLQLDPRAPNTKWIYIRANPKTS